MSAAVVPVPPGWGEQFTGLGLTCDIATAAKILGFGRTTAFELLRTGTFPVEVIGFGRVRRVRTADLFAYLHVPVPGALAPPRTPDPGSPSPNGTGDATPHAA